MATLTIQDLDTRLTLTAQAMSRVRGGGAAWVFGWIQPYVAPRATQNGVMNFYEVTNNFYADQMNNQFQTIDVRNTAPNSSISLNSDQGAHNQGRLV